MKKLRVVQICHRPFLPPDDITGLSADEIHPFRMEYDVWRALGVSGHEVIKVGVEDELVPIRQAIEAHRPHVVFNCLRFFHDIAIYDAHVVSYLELLKVPYTGANPRGLLLSNDKVLSKKILSYHRVRTPAFLVFRRGQPIRVPAKTRYPLIVKTVAEHASLGIAQASIVRDEEQLRERVAFVHEKIGHDAMAEAYIEGRELTVGVLGNERLTTFPVWELTFDNLPPGAPAIATAKVKSDYGYQERIGLRSEQASDLTPDQVASIQRLAKRIHRALELSGFARIDLRMDAEGRVFVLEANPNPDLSFGEDFAESAEAAGLDYDRLIQRIASLGIAYRPAWKSAET
ncbi:MAG: ATP-grasp domain-containing protein [Planctomycetota bacterium]|nr:ATP-grasp domain-containing protein [Planctomycetota bacterium]MDA1222270.1 ATP-grasp domain-containing protein [Planctomycetota bacterium]